MNNTLIEVQNLTHTYNQSLKVIDDLTFSINKNDFLTLVGPSGCGKSTFFKIITQLIKNYEGKITIKGQDLTDFKEPLGYMPQKDLLLPWRTLFDNVKLPLELLKKEVNEDELNSIIKTFGLIEFKDHYPHQLSGGMKQRTALLRTFLMGNDIVLLDEPFAALDYLTKRKLQYWFVDVFKKMNKTVIFITHDIEEAIILSNRVIVLSSLPAKILKEFKISENIDKTDPLDKEMLQIKQEIISLIG